MAQTKQQFNPELERKGRQLAKPSPWFALAAVALAVPGILLLILTSGWAWALGIALVALALVPTAVALGLFGTSAVARRMARERPFA